MNFETRYLVGFFGAILLVAIALIPSSLDEVEVAKRGYLFAKAEAILDELPADAAALTARAEILFLKGDYPGAENVVRQLTELEPQNPELWRMAVVIHSACRNAEATMKAYESLLAVAPGDSEALHQLAARYVFQQFHESAALTLHQLVQYYPEERAAWARLAQLQMAMGRGDAAAEVLDAALRVHSSDTEAAALQHLVLQTLGRKDELLAAAIRWTEQNPDDRIGRIRLGSVFYDRGEFAEAEKVFSGLSTDAEIIGWLAWTYSAMGDTRAVPLFEELTRSSPENIDLRIGLAGALVRAGYDDKAIAVYQEILDLDPTNSYARMGLAYHFYHARDFPRVVALLTSTDENPPEARALLADARRTLEDARYDRAEALINRGNYDAAMALLGPSRRR